MPFARYVCKGKDLGRMMQEIGRRMQEVTGLSSGEILFLLMFIVWISPLPDIIAVHFGLMRGKG